MPEWSGWECRDSNSGATEKWQKSYELRGIVEVDQTCSNFNTKFLGGRVKAERKRRVLNRRARRSRSEEEDIWHGSEWNLVRAKIRWERVTLTKLVNFLEDSENGFVWYLRSLAKSGELFYGEDMENDCEKPMNYEEWSKSRELRWTFRSIIVETRFYYDNRKNLDQVFPTAFAKADKSVTKFNDVCITGRVSL